MNEFNTDIATIEKDFSETGKYAGNLTQRVAYRWGWLSQPTICLREDAEDVPFRDVFIKGKGKVLSDMVMQEISEIISRQNARTGQLNQH